MRGSVVGLAAARSDLVYRLRRLVAGEQASRLFTMHSRQTPHPLCFRVGSSDLSVYREVFVDREFAFLAPTHAEGLIIDCGANVGYSSAYLLSRFPQRQLIAIEPDTNNLDLLERNLAPYGSRATALHAAVWPHAAPLRIEERRYRDGRDWSRQVRPCRDGEAPDLQGIDIPTLLRGAGHETI